MSQLTHLLKHRYVRLIHVHIVTRVSVRDTCCEGVSVYRWEYGGYVCGEKCVEGCVMGVKAVQTEGQSLVQVLDYNHTLGPYTQTKQSDETHLALSAQPPSASHTPANKQQTLSDTLHGPPTPHTTTYTSSSFPHSHISSSPVAHVTHSFQPLTPIYILFGLVS